MKNLNASLAPVAVAFSLACGGAEYSESPTSFEETDDHGAVGEDVSIDESGGQLELGKLEQAVIDSNCDEAFADRRVSGGGWFVRGTRNYGRPRCRDAYVLDVVNWPGSECKIQLYDVGPIPRTKEDCERLNMNHDTYEMVDGEYVLRSQSTLGPGIWLGDECRRPGLRFGIGSGDRYRLVVQTLRDGRVKRPLTIEPVCD